MLLYSRAQRVSLIVLCLAVIGCLVTAVTALNAVPASNAVDSTGNAQTIAELTPSQCTGLGLTDLVLAPSGGGAAPGTPANDLIIGTGTGNVLGSDAAGQGSDCCVGGSGDTFKASCTVRVQ